MSDLRPPIWIGHVAMGVPDVAAATKVMEQLGMRLVEGDDGISILELRGGTHLLILRSETPVAAGTPAPFDLMVDDLDASRERYAALGLAPGPIETVPHHRAFRVSEPNGYAITIQSSHVEGPV